MTLRLSGRRTGWAVLAVLAAALVVIVLAAYHGSDTASTSACNTGRGLLHRVAADTATAQRAAANGGAVPPASAGALQRDDNDLNNFINGEQTPDRSFDARALPVADGLGRVVTDLSQHTSAVADLNRAAGAAATANTACGG